MGYALMFARKLHNNAKKNQLNYETSMIQLRKENITKQLSSLQQMENNVKAMAEQSGTETPDLTFLNLQRTMLTLISNNLDTRLQCIQTQLSSIAAEEKSVDDTLQAQIASSTPKYVG